MLEKVFDHSTNKHLRTTKNPGDKLTMRIEIVGGVASSRWNAVNRQRILAHRRAWEAYLRVANECGLLDGENGKELVNRLRSRGDDDLRSSMAECLVCWYCHKRLNLPVEPKPPGKGKKQLEMLVKHPDGDLNVEVKAPLRETAAKTWRWNDADALEKCLRKANKQFRKGLINVLAIVPVFRTPVTLERNQLLNAFFGKLAIRITVGEPASRDLAGDELVIKPSGRFVRPAKPDRSPGFTRVSGVVCIEERLRDRYPLDYVPIDDEQNFKTYMAKLWSDKNRHWFEHRVHIAVNPLAPVKMPALNDDTAVVLQVVDGGLSWIDGRLY